MHIALNCSSSIDAVGNGIGFYVNHLVNALAEVSEASDQFNLVYWSNAWSKRNRGIHSPDHRFSINRLWDVPSRLPFPWTWGVDIFHGLSMRMPRARFPREVVTLHDLYSFKTDLWQNDSPGVVRFHQKHQKRLPETLKRAHAIICVSENTRTDLARILPEVIDRALVIQHGIEQNPGLVISETDVSPPLRELSNKSFLLHLGSFAPVRNLPRTVEAFAEVVKEIPEAMLVLAGPPRAEQRLVEARIKDLKLQRNILLPGLITDLEKQYLLRIARGLIMFHLYAGFGFPALEAMAEGTPVAVSREGSLPEVCGESALYADHRDIQEMKDAMLKLISDGETRADLVRTGREHARQFTWKKTATETYKVYEELYSA